MANSKTSILNDDEVVRTAYAEGLSRRDILHRLDLRSAGGNYKALYKALDRLGLPYVKDEWKVLMSERGRVARTKIPNELIFVEDSSYSNRSQIKARMRLLGVPFNCGNCGVGEEWNGLPLTLQLEHKNGVHNDHRLDNLCLLCPNCHSQTDTFAGRNSRQN